MRNLIFAIVVLASATAEAQVYKCPQFYPGADKTRAPLTGAVMTQAELRANGYWTDDEAAEEGYDVHYAFDGEEQTWLVCLYGGKQRIKGRFHDGHEWNQRMESTGIEWPVKLPPTLSRCTVQTREIKPRAQASAWTVTASCEFSR